jgi:hypothetical protein
VEVATDDVSTAVVAVLTGLLVASDEVPVLELLVG